MLPHKYLIVFVYSLVQLVDISSCSDGSTLAFAIDDTRSMYDDIDQVRAQAKNIMNIVINSNATDIKDMVLVTINDPDVILRTKTTSPREFIDQLDRIRVHNYLNRDCEEMSLTGIEKALLASRQGSYVYVFTDASAKDYEKAGHIKNLCQKKQSQVIFVLTGDCWDPNNKMYRVYYDIAEACSGQVFRVEKDQVGSILEVLKILLRATTSVFKWTNVPPSHRYIPVLFDLDEKAEYALVSTSGRNVHLRVTTTGIYEGPEPEHKRVLWTKNGRALELIHPKPGTYYAWVRGDSSVSVVVYGRTDFTFDYGFSILEPKSMNDATKQPIAGAKQHISINVTDPDNSVNIKTLQILDIKNKDALIIELPLRKRSDGLYITDSFVSPKGTFRIAVKGVVKKTKEPIVRNSRTNVNPIFVDLTPQSAPVVNIAEGSVVDVKYGFNVTLTCNVRAHPPPMIEWTAKGNLIPTKSSEKAKPDYISYLSLSQVKRGETYVCRSSNRLGRGEKSVRVNVPSVFTKPGNNGNEKITPKFGEDVKLPCEIDSYLPITRKWFKSGIEVVPSDRYVISPDGSELTLKALSVEMQGTYTCEATLNSDPTVKDARLVEVIIPGLAPPKILPSKRKIFVKEGEKFELDCSSQGYPQPEVKWEKSNSDRIAVSVKNNILKVEKSTYQHAGQYTCVATNPLDSDTAVFDVVVTVPPKVAVEETTKTLPYDSTTVLVCKGEAYPPPSVQWRDGNGLVVYQQLRKVSEYQFTSTLHLTNLRKSVDYTCVVSNTDATVNDKVSITVLSPFVVNEHIVGNTKLNYGASKTLKCNIKSDKKMTIRWYLQRKGDRSGRTPIVSSDKYIVSKDGTNLTIRDMDLDMPGQYTCEAALVSNSGEKVTYNTDVDVVGLIAPKIVHSNRNIHVREGEEFELDCRTSQGSPKPQVKWEKSNANQIAVSVRNDILTVRNSTYQHAGRYTCNATNPLDSDTAVFDVVVTVPPKVDVGETTKTLPYDSTAEIVCKGEAYPPPTVQWRDGNGVAVPHQQLRKVSEYQFTSTLQLTNLRNSVDYTCVVSNKDATVDDKVSITVLSPFVVNEHIQGATGINYGASETLDCNIRSNKDMTIRWYLQRRGVKSERTTIVSSGKYTVSRDGTKLTIRDMALDMAGQYTCEAALVSNPGEKVTYNTDVDVVGLIAPEVISATTLLDGKNFSAVCRVKGVPKPAISWQFKPKGSAEFHFIPGSEEVLNIPEIKLSHTGIYKCIAKNVLDKIERDFNVVVEEKPTITSTVLEHYGLEGDLVMKIPCNVTGFPEPTIVWKKGGVTITPHKKYTIKDGTLYVKKPVTSDSETYVCEATNKIGTDSKPFEVMITDTFTDDDNFNGKTHEVIAELGKPETIKCNVKDTQKESVRWYKDGVPTSQTGNIYTIDHTTRLDEGNYTCRLNTNEGSKSETFIVHIGYAPVFEDNRPSPITINWQSSAQVLDCSADSQPIAKYDWYHNGKLISTGYNMVQKLITDWGAYTCYVHNTLGSIDKSFNVMSEGCFISKTISRFTPNQPLASDQDTPTWTYSISNSDIFLKENEDIKFSCPTNSRGKSANSFKIAPEKKEVIAKCVSRDEFTVAGEKYKYSELQCNNKVEPLVQPTGEQCFGRNSEMIRVGFPVNGFIEAYRVCYDTHLNVSIYANTTSPALRIGSGANGAQFEWNPTPELGDVSPGDWEPEGSCKCCYTKGALLDSNQLPFGPAQAATFKNNLNSVPVWNPTCDSDDSPRISWQSFSEKMREISLIYDNWSSWTGASDYRYTDDGLVPRYLWRVVKFEGEVSVTVFVNGAARASDVRCGGACDSLTESDAFLYCCDAREFQDKFGVLIDTFMT